MNTIAGGQPLNIVLLGASLGRQVEAILAISDDEKSFIILAPSVKVI